VEAYARRHRLRWVEDDSNADDRFARNRLRRQVWPALVAAFPEAESTLAMAATWAQQAASIAAGAAADDLAAITDADRLHIPRWLEMPEPRRSHALRAWLHERCGRPVPPSLGARLCVELDERAVHRWPAPGGELHSYRGRLSFAPTRAVRSPAPPLPETSPPVPAMHLDLSRPGRHEVPAWRGSFRVDAVAAGGLAVARAARLELRARRPDDRFQAGAGRPPRSLKLQFQAAAVPSQGRQGPIVCCDGVLVYVPGLGMDARAVALPGEEQVTLTWSPD
jgi:tRNA(Ile)-lysidine synthase